MKRSVCLLMLLGVVASSPLACAKSAHEEPFPTHPYSLWVDELEPGQTRIEEVRARFGEPSEVEQGPRGEKIWRYDYREIDWPENDPMRPVVAADGTLQPRERSAFGRFVDWLGGVSYWVDRAIFFPPRQDRAPRMRQLPATVHRLEVVFGSNGTLRRYRYSPYPGYARVAVLR